MKPDREEWGSRLRRSSARRPLAVSQQGERIMHQAMGACAVQVAETHRTVRWSRFQIVVTPPTGAVSGGTGGRGGEEQPEARHVRGGRTGREESTRRVMLRAPVTVTVREQSGSTGDMQPRREQSRMGEGGGGGMAGWEGAGRWPALHAWVRTNLCGSTW